MSKQTERDAFRSRWGFILACIGSAVGMGNIWRFPYLVSAWGGMTFLLPYFLFVLLIGSTGIIGEMALGRSTRSGPIGAFGQAAALRPAARSTCAYAVGAVFPDPKRPSPASVRSERGVLVFNLSSAQIRPDPSRPRRR